MYQKYYFKLQLKGQQEPVYLHFWKKNNFNGENLLMPLIWVFQIDWNNS